MFGYPCPFCKQQLLAAHERSGQRTICPKCLKPIVIPSPEWEADFQSLQADEPNSSLQYEVDEVPISIMPDRIDFEPLGQYPKIDRIPKPEQRPTARIGTAVGDTEEPIPLQPAAAALVRNPDSDLYLNPNSPPLETDEQSENESRTSSPLISPTPIPIPIPTFPEPEPHRQANMPPTKTTPPIAVPTPIQSPNFPVSAQTEDDHPATSDVYTQGPGHLTNELVVFSPTDVEAANIAAHLTTVISMTMKPAPEPPSDLRFTTGLWIILTTCGLALWLFCMISDAEPLLYVAVIGSIELVFGYLWIAIAWGKRNPASGLATLFPPLWIYRAVRAPNKTGYRPLRYVFAGALLLVLFFISPIVQPTLFNWFGAPNHTPSIVSDSPQSPLVKLQNSELDGDTLGIKQQLIILSKPESMILIRDSDKPAIISILKRFVRGNQSVLKQHALQALTIWSREDAKSLVHSSLTGDDEELRDVAFELISAWNDPETVHLLLSLVAKDSMARGSLEEIGRTEFGRSALEESLIPLIRANTIENRNLYLALASEFGGEKLLPILKEQLSQSKVSVEQEPLRLCIAKIQARLRK